MEGRQPKILVVDNDDGMVAALETRLRSVGYDCATAVTGAQALEVFRRSDIDLVLTDLNMPHGDGVTLIRQIRAISEVPIVILTGFKREYRQDLFSLYNVSVLKKPCDSNEVLELIDAELMLSGAELPREELG